MAHAPDVLDDPVRAFYSAHPYPPPVDNLDRARNEWSGASHRRAEFHLFWPDRPYRDDLEILVAGCGTWQAAKYAVCHPDAHVVGIDVSPTSLLHTERLQRHHRLDNLELHPLAIEEAAKLERRFDLVVCTGVLHHLADPDTGLRALRSLLTPDGALYAMVYAPYGRIGISMIRDYCRRLGIGASPQELDDLAATLRALPPQHPLAAALQGARDTATRDALADALLNPRDRTYSVPEIYEFLERAGCGFGRWHAQAPYLPECGSIAGTPHGARLARLPAREQHAAMELWRGTMTTHSVVAYRQERRGGQPAGVQDERWRRYVPVRLPFTVCLEERIPAGAAAVLLNRRHTYADLVVPLMAAEKRWLDAIDGRRSISEIVGSKADILQWSAARSFFQQLWQYDQIVFDTSLACSPP